jgi:hypothetical protein
MAVVHFETEELGRLRRQEIRTHEFRVAANHNWVHDGGLMLFCLNLRVLVDWIHSRVFSRGRVLSLDEDRALQSNGVKDRLLGNKHLFVFGTLSHHIVLRVYCLILHSISAFLGQSRLPWLFVSLQSPWQVAGGSPYLHDVRHSSQSPLVDPIRRGRHNLLLES